MHTQGISLPTFSRTRAGIIGLSAISWCVLWLWGQSAYAAFLDHGDWTQAGLFQSLCASVPGINQTMALALSLLSWILMVQGMMLPVSAKVFERLISTFKDHRWSIVVMMSFGFGYLLFSIIFGVVLHGVGYGIGVFANQTGMLLFDGWIVGAIVFALAGMFQFSAAKAHFTNQSCRLDCRSLLSKRQLPGLISVSLMGGLRHGFFCFMCCWALMCLMFVFWTGSLIWMLCISLLMVVERQSARLRVAVGMLLVVASFGVTVSHLVLT